MVIVNRNVQPKDTLASGNSLMYRDMEPGSRPSFKGIMDGLLESRTPASGGQEQAPSACMSYADAKARAEKAAKAEPCDDPLMQKKVEAAIRWLANYLGIKPALLLAVMNELGIDPKDLADRFKFLEIINKLAEYFNLDEEQKKEVMENMGGGILGFSF